MDISKHSLAKVKLLSDVAPESLEELSNNCRWREFKTDEVVLDRNNVSREVYFITDGYLRVMNIIGTDREVTLAE